MKNKQRKRRSLAVIAVLILCILPILTFGASAAESERDEVFATDINERRAWDCLDDKFLPGTDWFIDSLQARFDYGIPDMLYAFEMGSYKHFVYGTEWFENLDPGFFTDQTTIHEQYFLGSGVFAFHGPMLADGNFPRSVFPAEISVVIQKSKDYSGAGYCTSLGVELVAVGTTENRIVTIWITMKAAETEFGVGYYVDSGSVSINHMFDGSFVYQKTLGYGESATVFAAMDLNSSLMTGYPITDVRQFMQIFADVEDAGEILFFPAEYYAGYEAGYDTAAKQGTGKINALESENAALQDEQTILQDFAKTEYTRGFGEGQTDAYNAKNTLGEVIFQIFNAPVDLINGMLDFELFGINVASTVKTLLTLAITTAIVFFVIKLKS